MDCFYPNPLPRPFFIYLIFFFMTYGMSYGAEKANNLNFFFQLLK